ncbi:SMI1/KNR4 family protein [Bacillus infantis]|uniref:SMI1/KNR4 family protein n=1 Tax=Bacillus infantis TaxID=324767 RepID=UPI00209EDD61|nr:SMI1/KNR4 family protein [Bacillus infantis]
MSQFDFIKNGIHNFYKVTVNDIISSEKKLGISFPIELREFFKEVGYGFIKGKSVNSINRFMDPNSIAEITLREGYYEYDPDLEIYDEKDKLIFYEVNEGVYLTLDLNSTPNTPVYYFDAKIADSLTDFMKKVDKDSEYFKY